MPAAPIQNPRSARFRINELTEGNALPLIELVIPILREEEQYSGNSGGLGCCIVAGGNYLRYAYGAVKQLRSLDAEIPIEIWHLPGEDMASAWKFEPFGVRFRDLGPVFDLEHSQMRNGFAGKLHCLKATSFRHAMLLDADNFPLKAPSAFFETKQYGTDGLLLWPDVAEHNNGMVWPALGLKYKSVPEHESGQIFIDRKKHWETICLATWMVGWPWMQQAGCGDKNLLGLAAEKLRAPFFTMPTAKWSGWGITQHDFDGTPAFLHQMSEKRGGESPPPEYQKFWKEFDNLLETQAA